METPPGPRSADPHLEAFLRAASDEQAAGALSALLGGETERTIHSTVRRELGRSPVGASHVEDVAGEVRVRLVRKLWNLRAGIGEPIEHFHAYVVVTAEYACHAFLRRQYPERTRFRNRVRYALSHHPGTSLTRDENGNWTGATRSRIRAAPGRGAARAFLDDPAGWLALARVDAGMPLPALLNAILSRLDEPIELEQLVAALARVLGIADAPPSTPREDDGDALQQLPDPAPRIHDVMEQREELSRVWREIAELPSRQRSALLLNLRDPEGGAVLQMLSTTGVVEAGAIAAALEITTDELARLWERLPLDDLSIASQLGLTRQQVINLRKSARARLARRLAPARVTE